MSNRGILFVLSAPAGTGKTTVVNEVLKQVSHLRQNVSFTTRPKRPQEIEGVHYHFVSEEQFFERRAEGEFLEEVELFGYRYATSKSEIEAGLQKGHHMILIIDTEGAKRVREAMAAITIFLLPPSLDVLRQRLVQRRTESALLIEERLKVAQKELNQRKFYDYQVVNDQLLDCVTHIQSIILAEECRTSYIESCS